MGATSFTSRDRHVTGTGPRPARREPPLPVSDVIVTALTRLPVVATTGLFGAVLKGVDLVATNGPGLTGRVHLAAAATVGHA